jgi:hypothetical protein
LRHSLRSDYYSLEIFMAEAAAPFWVRFLSAANSVTGWFGKQAAIARDKRLKKFTSELNWVDGRYAVTLSHDRILAESADAARALAIEQARKDYPVVEEAFDGKILVPPYADGGNAALNNWVITTVPLTEFEVGEAAQGRLGPARVDGSTTKSLGQAPG